MFFQEQRNLLEQIGEVWQVQSRDDVALFVGLFGEFVDDH